MFCPKCGSQLKENAKFCTKCGNPVKFLSQPSNQFTEEPGQKICPAEIRLEETGSIHQQEQNQAVCQMAISRQEDPPNKAVRKRKEISGALQQSERRPPKRNFSFLAIVIAVLCGAAAAAAIFFFVSGVRNKNEKPEEDVHSVWENREEDRAEEKEDSRKKNTKNEDDRNSAASEKAAEPGKEAETAQGVPTETVAEPFSQGTSVTCQVVPGYDRSTMVLEIPQIAAATDSSHLPAMDEEHVYTAYSAFDGVVETSWQTNINRGIGQSVTAQFHSDFPVTLLTFRLGNHRSADWYGRNGRPSRLRIGLGDQEFTIDFPDQMEEFSCPLSRPVESDYITVTVENIYPGSEYEDMVIAEVGIYAYSE